MKAEATKPPMAATMMDLAISVIRRKPCKIADCEVVNADRSNVTESKAKPAAWVVSPKVERLIWLLKIIVSKAAINPVNNNHRRKVKMTTLILLLFFVAKASAISRTPLYPKPSPLAVLKRSNTDWYNPDIPTPIGPNKMASIFVRKIPTKTIIICAEPNTAVDFKI